MPKLTPTTFFNKYKQQQRYCVYLQFVDWATIKKRVKGKKLTLKATGLPMPTPNRVIAKLTSGITWKGDYALDSVQPSNQRVMCSEPTDAEQLRKYFQTKGEWERTEGKPCTASCRVIVYDQKHKHLATVLGLL